MQTSDGEDCGLVKNISLTGILSSSTDEAPVMAILLEHGMQYLEEMIPSTLDRADKVFMNGKWVGTLDQSQEVVDVLRAFRRKGSIFEEVETHCKNLLIFRLSFFLSLFQFRLFESMIIKWSTLVTF